jgi:hypothetical protein
MEMSSSTAEQSMTLSKVDQITTAATSTVGQFATLSIMGVSTTTSTPSTVGQSTTQSMMDVTTTTSPPSTGGTIYGAAVCSGVGV